jgi:putative cell wall-binding protein
VVTLGSSRGRGPRGLALLPAVALACAAFAVRYLAAPPPVQAGSATQLQIATFTDTGIPTDGVQLQLAVIPADANGDVDTCFDDTVHYSDPYAIVPPDYTFNSTDIGIACLGDRGFHGFDITPTRPGPQTLTVTDLNNASIKGTFSIDVLPGPASSFVLSPPAKATLGSEAGFSLTVKDAYGFTATNYTGAVHFTSSDSAATLPADYTFNADDAGAHVFPVTFNTTGSQSVTVTDTGNPSVNATATTTVSKAPHFEIWCDDQATAGYISQCDIDATKDDGTPDTSYAGTIHLTSSDTKADLGPNIKFTGGGWVGCEVSFETAGTQTLTATDVSNQLITGTTTIEVLGGDAVSAKLNGLPPSMIAGPVTVAVTAKDAYGNNASSADIKFTSSDPKAVLPVGIVYFHTTDYGTRQFKITMETKGPQTVTITSASISKPFSDTRSVNVLRGAACQLIVGGLSSPRYAGAPGSLMVRATDAYGNTDPDYHGTIHFTSTDTKAVMPADYAFVPSDAGSHVFSVTLKTAGSQWVRATDTVTASITGSQSGIVVKASIVRYSGADRFATAAAVSAHTFGSPCHCTAYIATAYNFPDALAGAAAAGTIKGPVLFVAASGAIDSYTATELLRLKPDHIVVLGGTGVVSAAVFSALAAYAPAGQTVRYAGADRFATAAAVSLHTFPSNCACTAYVATAYNFPDALAGAAAAGTRPGPVLLVNATGAINAATKAELVRLKPAHIVVLGGTGVVSAAVYNLLKAYAPAGQIARYAGSDRYGTAASISAHTFAASCGCSVYVAAGTDFNGALAAAAAAGTLKGPLLLVATTGAIPAATATELTRLKPAQIIVVGNTSLVSAAVYNLLAAYVP